MKNKVAWFEIPASDFQKAKQFYEAVFDWKIDLWGDEGAMATTTAIDKDQNPIEPGGINGGFYKRKSKGGHSQYAGRPGGGISSAFGIMISPCQ